MVPLFIAGELTTAFCFAGELVCEAQPNRIAVTAIILIIFLF
jgi:hypothetical protein